MALAAARCLFIVAVFSGFGALGFLTWVAPGSSGASITARLERLARRSLSAAVVAALAWLVLETGNLTEAETPGAVIEAIPFVLGHTNFGRVLALEFGALAAALACLFAKSTAFSRKGALCFALAATALQAGHGHGLAMYKGLSFLLLSNVAHLLSGGAWLGALLPLWLFVREASPRDAAQAARNFSILGKICVIGILVSAGFQGWVLIGGFPGLVGSAYGWAASVKILLFVILLGFAAFNRYRLTPALETGDAESARRQILRSIGLETGVGVLVVMVAVILTSLPPAMHDQPVWPFTLRPSLAAVREDPEFLKEALTAGAELATAIILLVGCPFVRWRARLLPVVTAGILAWIALPHLDLLFVPASPTSFYRSPTGFSANSIVDGAALYSRHCASCHGAEGRGDGPGAAGLPVPPADLTAEHLWAHDDGEMFGWLTQGIEAPDGRQAMPGFEDVLSEDQRWALIDYVRAHNGGLVRASTGAWSPPLHAPGFAALCPDGRGVSLTDLQGRIVRLVFPAADAPLSMATPPRNDVVTIAANSKPGSADGDGCAVEYPAIGQAYAIVSGVAPEAMAGSQFLIDGNGWLRAILRPTATGNGNADALQAEIDRINANPIMMAAGAPMHHHH